MNKAVRMGFTQKYIKKNNVNYKAEYQDYDWCFEQFINQGKTINQIANETGYSVRVLQKWINEKYKLSNKTFRSLIKLTKEQYSIILAGTLGDGHIDKREKYAIYIESHAENQKDYMFWKYNILKNLCLSEPRYYKPETKIFKGKSYQCKATYRMETRAIDELKTIRDKSISERLEELDVLGFCTHILDDASRNKDSWTICLGDWTQEEIEKYIGVVKIKFDLHPKQMKDKRYVRFNSEESYVIDNMILNNIPNDLDIVQDKIINNKYFKAVG